MSGLLYKGFQRQKCRSDRNIYNLYCHKSAAKNKEHYCGFYFQARCQFPKNTSEWRDPENWSYVSSRKFRPSHRLISDDGDQIKKNLLLRQNNSSCCNVPSQRILINSFNNMFKQKCKIGESQPIERAFDQLKAENPTEIDVIIESEILSKRCNVYSDRYRYLRDCTLVVLLSDKFQSKYGLFLTDFEHFFISTKVSMPGI